MATGGTGDVLTGVIAALLAQKLAPFEAAQLGVFIHGLAGDIARDQNGEIGLIAGDLVDALPDAFVHAMPDPDRWSSLGLTRDVRFRRKWRPLVYADAVSSGVECCRELNRIARSGSLRAAEKRRGSRLERAKEV